MYEPAFLEALIARATQRRAWLNEHPVCRKGTYWMQQHKKEIRERENMRLSGVCLNATILLERDVIDEMDVECAEKELDNWLHEDHGRLESEAWALVRRAVA